MMRLWYVSHVCQTSSVEGCAMFKTQAFIGAALALFAFSGCGDTTPVAPTSLVIKSTSPITLSWDVNLAASSYKIYRGTASGGLSTKVLLATNAVSVGIQRPATTYTDTSTMAGVTYYYQVTDVNWDKESAPSNEVNATP